MKTATSVRRLGGGLALAALSLLLPACDTPAGIPVGVGPGSQAVAEVEVTPPTARVLEIGETVQFTATPRSAEGEELNTAVTWSSSDIGVAVVDATGQATAVGPGQVDIVARAGDASGSAVLSVAPVGSE